MSATVRSHTFELDDGHIIFFFFASFLYFFFFFFNATATTEIYTLSLHDALPISIGAFGSCVFTITALARCTSMSLYLISSIGCKENSYDFFGGNHEWTRMNTNWEQRR